MKKTRLWAFALFVMISVFALSFAFLSSADQSTPILYRNDTKYSISDYPAEMIDGKIHVPVSFFIGLENIQYEYGTDPAGFYLRNKNTGRFFSFSFNANGIVVDSSLVDMNFPIANSTVYLPLEYCADILSLSIEKKAMEDALRIRLVDGTQKLTFDDLIELYDPTVDPEKPPTISPDKPTDPIVTPTPSRNIYITLDAVSGEYLDAILTSLESNGRSATFFFTANSIKENPKAVIRTFVMGHGIGVMGDTMDELSEANRALYSVLNYNTRICRTNGDTAAQAESRGYINYGYDIDADILSANGARAAARDAYNKTFEKNTTVVKLTASEITESFLDRLFYYLSGDSYISDRIIETTLNLEVEA